MMDDYYSYTGFPGGPDSKESCSAGDLGSIPGLGRSPGEGHGYTLQYSGLENSVNCVVHGVTKSRTRLRDFHFITVTQQVYCFKEATKMVEDFPGGATDKDSAGQCRRYNRYGFDPWVGKIR